MNFQGAIFDMDGTLTDSMWIWEDLAKHFLEKRLIPPEPGQNALFHNMTFESSSQYLAQHYPLDMTAEEIQCEWMDMVYPYYEKELDLKLGAFAYLQHLRQCGVKLALLTSNFRKNGEAFLKRNGIFEWFDVIMTSDEAGKGKENPALYLQTAKELRVSPQYCMVFEDILIAVQSAKSAGMMVTAVEDGASQAERDAIKRIADRYLVSFRELLL